MGGSPDRPSAPADDRIALGIIRKPHGVRGEASVEVWSDRPERFFELQAVILVSPEGGRTKHARIDAVRVHPPRLLILFEGIGSPEEMRDFQGWTIEVPASEARALDEGEYFFHDLEGMALYADDERFVGTVTEVAEGGGGVLLTVKRADGGSFDLPFASEFCDEIDVAAKRMRVHLPPGLEDLRSAEEVRSDEGNDA